MGAGVGKVAARHSHSEGSFVRWQAIAIAQMGYAVNLILTFATAALGFALATIKNLSQKSPCWGGCFLVLAGISLMISITIGICCVLNRLRDFRESAQIARKRERWEDDGVGKTWIDDQLRCRRRRNEERGKLSNKLFDRQVRSFGLGAVLLVMAFVAVYLDCR